VVWVVTVPGAPGTIIGAGVGAVVVSSVVVDVVCGGGGLSPHAASEARPLIATTPINTRSFGILCIFLMILLF
jgi:hypothetical protein